MKRAITYPNSNEISTQDVSLVRRRLLKWFAVNGRSFPWRKHHASRYNVIVAEVLLQRTRAEHVSRFFEDFISRFESWTALSQASLPELRSFLRPIGLWR